MKYFDIKQYSSSLFITIFLSSFLLSDWITENPSRVTNTDPICSFYLLWISKYPRQSVSSFAIQTSTLNSFICLPKCKLLLSAVSQRNSRVKCNVWVFRKIVCSFPKCIFLREELKTMTNTLQMWQSDKRNGSALVWNCSQLKGVRL